VWSDDSFTTVDAKGHLNWSAYVWVNALAVFTLDAGEHNIVLCVDRGDANVDKIR
jgi:hypothetical protein